MAGAPDDAFTIEELCKRVYAHTTWRVEKKHRVAVIRAAKAMIERSGGYALKGYGGRGSALVVYTAESLTSCGIAHLKTWGRLAHMPADWLRNRLTASDCLEYMAPGGAWWIEVELARAERNGDAERVGELKSAIERRNQGLMEQMRALG
jgi:hypothetical protein